MQLRVRLRLDRLSELSGRADLNADEARELARLRHMENVRLANQQWRSRGDNRSRCVALTRQWRQANPGMSC